MNTCSACGDLVSKLRKMAAIEFDLRGPHDARGAAIWDIAAYIDECHKPKHEARKPHPSTMAGKGPR